MVCFAALFSGQLRARADSARLDLGGAWSVHQADQTEQIPAQVPGGIFLDLMRAGKIPDPFIGENEKKVQWVGETGWVYRREFRVAPALLQHDFVLLRADGLDTLATVKINDKELGSTDNMFRNWEWNVKPYLKAGTNSLQISFASTFPYIKAHQKEPFIAALGGLPGGGEGFVRKAPYQYGWDWGPRLVDCGIWKPIEIMAYDTARIGAVGVSQDHSQAGVVGLTVRTDVAETAANLRAQVIVSLAGKEVARDVQTLRNGGATSVISVRNPQLWWPNGMGAHPLYDVTVRLLRGAQNLDETTKRIGLRTFALLPATAGHALQLSVNGVPFFAKGANWIPADSFPTRVTSAKLRASVADCVATNMNVLRLWGGGYYEEDALFDACDENGIAVWLDFKFANHAYPTYDSQWMENVRLEIAEQAQRLRHHACIAVWCGNNELTLQNVNNTNEWQRGSMSRTDYDRMFGRWIPAELRKWEPDAVYTPGSPEVGDEHYWGVYHGGAGFESYRQVHGFLTEFGMQSFPEPRTVEAFTAPADRVSVETPVMRAHQKSRPNAVILGYINRYFRAPKTFDDTLWLSQIMQGYGVEIGAESWRREMPRSTACIFWQLNDCWPVASWSSVDYYGRWKALQFLARRFYAPVLVSGTTDATTGRAGLWLTSDLRQPVSGVLRWQVTDSAGNSLREGQIKTEIAPQSSREIQVLELGDLLQTHGVGDVLVWLDFQSGESSSSGENLLIFGKPKNLELRNPQIKTQIKSYGDSFLVTLTAQYPALWSWVSLTNSDATLHDNFVHLRANSPRTFHVTPASPMTLAQFRAQLKVRSLFDTYDPNAQKGAPGDLAFGRAVVASSTEANNGNLAANINDDDAYSRWSSEYSDPQWIAVDLGEIQPIAKVKLSWENAFAKAYQIQVSDDGQNWRSVYQSENGKGGVEEIALPDGTRARWVRMLGTKRATEFGYSLWSFEVY